MHISIFITLVSVRSVANRRHFIFVTASQSLCITTPCRFRFPFVLCVVYVHKRDTLQLIRSSIINHQPDCLDIQITLYFHNSLSAATFIPTTEGSIAHYCLYRYPQSKSCLYLLGLMRKSPLAER